MPEQSNKQSAVQLEAHLRVLRAVHANPLISQRELSRQLGISLGKANYCVKALLEEGWIKTRNFKNNDNKVSYSYLLTPKGIEHKLKLTLAFLKAKQEQFELLSQEIEQLRLESSDKQ